ncbi:hypothetical protein [Nitrosomonas ureae]|uniref:Prohead serine protease n=1 Tax=Nitrosomonas ureae TaxID=44577 RepID=A0A2T5ISR5_9PROT|nr:hypothetical protein [Nitrosomonas ureae]PTQ86874.1 hypothetical protein C8R28_100869 [Nitrosomonas ureae]
MPTTTPMIRYSLKERGRKYTGQSRNFNIQKIFDSVNGGACQETVNSRGMIGYYGHFPRIRFGMHPSEGGLDGGKYVPVQPAFITTHLKVTMDGMVEHQAEFLDTAAGQVAEKLFFQKVGGFSSAIDEKRPQFYGFDYVLQPNFLDNSFRGVAFDDALSGNTGDLTYDDVYAAEQEEHARSLIVLLDSIKIEREATSAVIERLQAENEQFLSMLASKSIDANSILDSVTMAPLTVDINPISALQKDRDYFHSIEKLPEFEEPVEEEVSEQQVNPTFGRLINKFMR